MKHDSHSSAESGEINPADPPTLQRVETNKIDSTLCGGVSEKPPPRHYLLQPSVETCPREIKAPSRAPRYRPGDRRPQPYSPDDLDALLATSRHFPAVALASLITPQDRRITDWPALETALRRFKLFLRNGRNRHRFPRAITVTEFGGVGRDAYAHFHIGFDEPLTEQQQAKLKAFWLGKCGLQHNQRRAFHYKCNDPDPTDQQKLQNYIAKDRVTLRKGKQLDGGSPYEWPKNPPDWVPRPAPMRLWFCIGHQRRSAAEGRAIRSQEEWRRSLPPRRPE